MSCSKNLGQHLAYKIFLTVHKFKTMLIVMPYVKAEAFSSLALKANDFEKMVLLKNLQKTLYEY